MIRMQSLIKQINRSFQFAQKFQSQSVTCFMFSEKKAIKKKAGGTAMTNTINPFNAQVIDPNVVILRNKVVDFRHTGKIDGEFIVLENNLYNNILKSQEEFIEIFATNKKYFKQILYKVLIMFFGVSFIFIFVINNRLATSYWSKIPCFLIGAGLIYYATRNPKLKIFAYVNKISIKKDLKSVLIETYPSKIQTFKIEDLFLGSSSTIDQPKEFISLYVKGSEYLMPLEHTTQFNEELLPLVLRGYSLK